MSQIEQYRSGTAISRGISRRVSRTLTHIEGETSTNLARIEACADLQAAKVDAATGVTQRGLQGVGYLTSIEMTLAEATPAAMTRLKLIGDAGTMALSQVVVDTASKLRRI